MTESIVLLFTKDTSSEPCGILQCDKTCEYYPFYFLDWRDGIHFLRWCEYNKKKKLTQQVFNEWCIKYGYDENEEFNGDLNEFRCEKTEPNKWYITTSHLENPIDGSCDLTKLSVW